MNVLDSPLEALAFNYVSFGFFTVVNNLWTWIAVVTAAVSFWRIRVAGGVFPAEESPPLDDRSSRRSVPAPDTPPEKPAPVVSPPPEEKSPSQCLSPTRCVEEVGATRGSPKFALYYYDNDTDGDVTVTEEDEELVESGGEVTMTEVDGEEWWGSWERVTVTEEEELVESDGEVTVTEVDGDEWWGSWERVLRTRMGKSETAGWYRYQDLTELNGNVVRLWDGRDCGREGSYYRGSKRCVLW